VSSSAAVANDNYAVWDRSIDGGWINRTADEHKVPCLSDAGERSEAKKEQNEDTGLRPLKWQISASHSFSIRLG
jgi:hypothetical protein